MTVDVVEILPEKGVIGKKYRKEAKPLMDWLAGLKKTEIEQLEKSLVDNGYMCVFSGIIICTCGHVTVM